MWLFTQHVLLRMKERGYTHDEILMVINGEVPVIVYPSPREKTVDLYFGKVDDKYLMIPVDRVKKSIITARPMRKQEKMLFLKEVENE
jgi:hypothetical protein